MNTSKLTLREALNRLLCGLGDTMVWGGNAYYQYVFFEGKFYGAWVGGKILPGGASKLKNAFKYFRDEPNWSVVTTGIKPKGATNVS